MSRVGGKDTAPELIVRKMVYGMGFRYRLYARDLPGRPDIVLRSRHKAIFVHGCFWHGHKNCKLARTPKSNVSFWEAKIDGNRNRDRRVLRQLRRLGWSTLTVWQCQLRTPDRVEKRIHEFLKRENSKTVGD